MRPSVSSWVGSMTWAVDSLASTSRMRPSIKACFSLAASYSAFSDRSPWARASEMALITAGRSTAFRRCSSSFRSSAPRLVIGMVLMSSFNKKMSRSGAGANPGKPRQGTSAQPRLSDRIERGHAGSIDEFDVV
ncbi:hypothetical protein CBM2589_B190154 [Cupriavidus taiwanensis]|uniref:Uncharacterized protein n=1 Tax=Cupriavidus taiwanensis TaxID=164546 RepID=A0A975WXE4_9BURK|nr:hypothetical protein CBM2589_B190154 [Cupriavidus taiwanensis]